MRAAAAKAGREVTFGIRLHFIVRETDDEAWEAANRLISQLDDATIEEARQRFTKESDSVGQQRMFALHGGRRDKLEVSPNLWAGIGLVRAGAGTALVGSPETVAERLREYQEVGIDTVIGSGYPHLEESYRVAELLFPALGLAGGEELRRLPQRVRPEARLRRRQPRRQPPRRVLIPAGAPPVARRARAQGVPCPMNRYARASIGWLLPLAIIVAWEGLARIGLISANVLPAPSAVVAAFWKLLVSGELVRNIGVSTWRALAGFAIGGSIGFALGLANGLSRLSRDLTDTTLQMIRNIPHLALIPLVILWFGIDEEAKLFLVALGRLLPDLRQHAARHPGRRPAARRDGPHLRHEALRPSSGG